VSLIVVSLGTDHHSFERMVTWSEAWVQQFTDWQLVVQHGYTRPPLVGTGFDFCGRQQLDELFERAQVVACHGGPGTITQVRRFGHTPIVVPRDPARGEHVDDHQQLFSRRLGASGVVALAESYDAFLGAVVAASFLPRQREGQDGDVPPGVFAVGKVVEELVTQRRAARSVGRHAE
jgi:UDP-N-acetylglucosamine transferase subunit ALG13